MAAFARKRLGLILIASLLLSSSCSASMDDESIDQSNDAIADPISITIGAMTITLAAWEAALICAIAIVWLAALLREINEPAGEALGEIAQDLLYAAQQNTAMFSDIISLAVQAAVLAWGKTEDIRLVDLIEEARTWYESKEALNLATTASSELSAGDFEELARQLPGYGKMIASLQDALLTWYSIRKSTPHCYAAAQGIGPSGTPWIAARGCDHPSPCESAITAAKNLSFPQNAFVDSYFVLLYNECPQESYPVGLAAYIK
ncbi:MAG: hypothetical protein IPJ88_12260 [Myxococcales bacterium]|nr:MAG: hypothetical protein IPJ88_12260 [Myxococcales bacterium]